MEQTLLFSEWVKTIGKEKLQAYQDSFARTFGISLCLLSLQGKALSIWSNSSLFCYYMLKNNRLRCLQERENAIKSILSLGHTRIIRCYMGLTFFISPVVYRGKIVCMAYGGGIILGSDRVCAGNELAKNITVMTENEFSDMLELMQNTLELLEFNVGIKKDNNDAKALTNRPANEYLYLKHRLSRREMDIAQAVCECLSNKQIGDKLFISEKTVKSHISNILAKMGMKDRMQLVMFCKEHGKE